MRTLWRGLGRIFFWSYERGSWPYDLMVVAIVIFVLLTPRSWFHDDPHTAAAAAAPGVALLSADAGDETRTYRIDATVLAPEKRQTKSTPELERETHENPRTHRRRIKRSNVSSARHRARARERWRRSVLRRHRSSVATAFDDPESPTSPKRSSQKTRPIYCDMICRFG